MPHLECGIPEAGVCHSLGLAECPSAFVTPGGLSLRSGMARRGEQNGGQSGSRQMLANRKALEMEGILAN